MNQAASHENALSTSDEKGSLPASAGIGVQVAKAAQALLTSEEKGHPSSFHMDVAASPCNSSGFPRNINTFPASTETGVEAMNTF